jgi:hypothetical protein
VHADAQCGLGLIDQLGLTPEAFGELGQRVGSHRHRVAILHVPEFITCVADDLAHLLQGVNLHRVLPRVALVLHKVVAIHGRGWARERTRGTLRSVVDVDANASSGRHVGAGHLEAVELTGRLEDCTGITWFVV